MESTPPVSPSFLVRKQPRKRKQTPSCTGNSAPHEKKEKHEAPIEQKNKPKDLPNDLLFYLVDEFLDASSSLALALTSVWHFEVIVGWMKPWLDIGAFVDTFFLQVRTSHPLSLRGAVPLWARFVSLYAHRFKKAPIEPDRFMLKTKLDMCIGDPLSRFPFMFATAVEVGRHPKIEQSEKDCWDKLRCDPYDRFTFKNRGTINSFLLNLFEDLFRWKTRTTSTADIEQLLFMCSHHWEDEGEDRCECIRLCAPILRELLSFNANLTTPDSAELHAKCILNRQNLKKIEPLIEVLVELVPEIFTHDLVDAMRESRCSHIPFMALLRAPCNRVTNEQLSLLLRYAMQVAHRGLFRMTFLRMETVATDIIDSAFVQGYRWACQAFTRSNVWPSTAVLDRCMFSRAMASTVLYLKNAPESISFTVPYRFLESVLEIDHVEMLEAIFKRPFVFESERGEVLGWALCHCIARVHPKCLGWICGEMQSSQSLPEVDDFVRSLVTCQLEKEVLDLVSDVLRRASGFLTLKQRAELLRTARMFGDVDTVSVISGLVQ